MTPPSPFRHYLRSLTSVASTGDAREESYYGALADMLTEVAQATDRADVHVTTLPKPTDVDNPDFRLWNGTNRAVSYTSRPSRPTPPASTASSNPSSSAAIATPSPT